MKGRGGTGREGGGKGKEEEGEGSVKGRGGEGRVKGRQEGGFWPFPQTASLLEGQRSPPPGAGAALRTAGPVPSHPSCSCARCSPPPSSLRPLLFLFCDCSVHSARHVGAWREPGGLGQGREWRGRSPWVSGPVCQPGRYALRACRPGSRGHRGAAGGGRRTLARGLGLPGCHAGVRGGAPRCVASGVFLTFPGPRLPSWEDTCRAPVQALRTRLTGPRGGQPRARPQGQDGPPGSWRFAPGLPRLMWFTG